MSGKDAGGRAARIEVAKAGLLLWEVRLGPALVFAGFAEGIDRGGDHSLLRSRPISEVVAKRRLLACEAGIGRECCGAAYLARLRCSSLLCSSLLLLRLFGASVQTKSVVVIAGGICQTLATSP